MDTYTEACREVDDATTVLIQKNIQAEQALVKAFYRPTAGAPRPCHLEMMVPDAGVAIIYPGGWTEPKAVPISQILMRDDVEDNGDSKSGHKWKMRAQS